MRQLLVLAGSATLVVAMAASPTSAASGPTAHAAVVSAPEAPSGSVGDDLVQYDARQPVGAQAEAAAARRTATLVAGAPAARLQRSLGDGGLFELDPATGTVRILEKLDGYLTGASGRPPRAVALAYVRAHRGALGLSAADLKTFQFHRDYVDIAGTHHLSWTQEVGGQKVFDAGLQAAVTRSGRLLTVSGSPVTKANVPVTGSRVLATSEDAITAARTDGAEPSAAPGPDDSAEEVVFVAGGVSHAAWQTTTMSAERPTLAVFDAATGRLLYRRPLAQDQHSTGTAVEYFPGAEHGGTPQHIDFTAKGWLPAGAKDLSGNNSHAYSDVNDDQKANPSEEVPPMKNGTWSYPLTPFHLKGVSFCDNPYPCTWNPDKPFSWRVNRAQNTTQVFTFVNRWHDHLMAAPIGFNEAAGNFQVKNRSHLGRGQDAVDTQTEDGADTDHGLPDAGHIDNANMATPPDGKAPRMQMYLQHQPGTSYPKGDPFAPTDVGDEADTVYHEYTHGLSNRLVVNANGQSTLGGVQAGAMGEAWSDWYAMDYLVDQGLQKDDPGKVDVVLFQFDGAGVALDRTEPIDCPLVTKAARCNGGLTGHQGGYSYKDYASVVGGPEVHSDGEIWAQTLWQLRAELGSRTTESLVTRAMELSPHNPSFLDMRNAILVADTAVFGGRHHDAIWRVFAARGMGFFAGSFGGDDIAPAASFARPPATRSAGKVTGVVTDPDSGKPVAGATVTLAFQGDGVVNPSAVTDASGHYSLGPVPQGHYGKLEVDAPGYVGGRASVKVGKGGAHRDFSARRDWAATSGGATVAEFNGPDRTAGGCGPAAALDLTQLNGWKSTTGDNAGTPTNVFVPKHLTVKLPQAITLTQLQVDPTATCGDGASASTGAYKIETSPDGSAWTTASQGAFTTDDQGSLVPLTPTAGAAGVRFVRFTILGNQVPSFATNCPDGAFGGCTNTDLTELEVFGTPAA
jgi:extracellular elastinolytic metalloproteinase